MMIFEYLIKKYGEDGPFALTAIEGKAFGIQYPLEPGWIDKYGAQKITPAVAGPLADQLYFKGLRCKNVSRANHLLAGATILRGIQ